MKNQPLKLSFKQTLSNARRDMNSTGKVFSIIIHTRVVELVSDLFGRVILRPIPVIFGSTSALLVGGALYIISVSFHYGWSGSELLLTFLIGWSIGLIYDYTLLLMRGRR